MMFALLPFALGLGIDLFVAAQKVFGWKRARRPGLMGALVAVLFWYVLGFFMRRERADG